MLKPILMSLVVAGGAVALPLGACAEMPSALGEISGRIVLVDFWASWCAPCRRSFPWMNEMLDRYGDRGLQIIGVNVDKKRSLAEEFLRGSHYSMNCSPAGCVPEKRRDRTKLF